MKSSLQQVNLQPSSGKTFHENLKKLKATADAADFVFDKRESFYDAMQQFWKKFLRLKTMML